MDYNTSPDYLKAADIHNTGNGDESFFSDPAAAIGNAAEGVLNFITKTPSFAVTSIASGINSIYNSGVVAGNWLGITDAEENDIQQTLGRYDSDLGQYYADHKQAADLTGFIATSLIPGIGGVKILNAGQKMLSGALKTGGMGRTLAEATGLIQTLTAEGKTLTTVAGEALAQGQQTFHLLDAGVLKAIGAGVVQSTLESAAFETMVAATMFRSPILEENDIKDLGWNILTGAAVGGVIGGAINAAGVYKGVKQVITKEDLLQKPYTATNSQFGLSEPSDKILAAASDLATTPSLEEAGAKFSALRNTRIQNARQEIRQGIHELTVKDTVMGNIVADTLHTLDGDQISKVMQGAKEVMRPGYEYIPAKGNVVGYVRLHGAEGVGDVTFDGLNKTSLTLADKLISKEQIKSFVESAKFSTKQPWNPITATSMDAVEARYIWAEKIAKYTEGMVIHQGDIALQEGALRKGLKSITIDGGEFHYTVTSADLANEVIQNKKALVDALGKAKKAGWSINADGVKGNPVGNTPIITSEEIARVANVSVKAIESSEGASMFARQDAQAAYDKMRAANNLTHGESDLTYVPKHAAVVYDTNNLAGATGDSVSAMVVIKQKQKLVNASVDNAVAGITGDLGERLYRPGDKLMLGANRYGAGSGLVTFANGSYNSLASWAENMGKVTSELQSKLKGNTSAIIDSAALRLRNNQVAAMEFDKINNMVAASAEKYVVNESGDGLVLAKLVEFRKASAEAKKAGKPLPTAPSIRDGVQEEIKFMNEDCGTAIFMRLESQGARTQHSKNLRAAQGIEDFRDPNAYYPIKPQPQDYPYFAFVKDNTVTGANVGHTSMIHAATAEQLDDMIKMVHAKTKFTVHTKSDAENFYKAQQDYEFDRTLHENYIDSSLKSNGVNNQFFPKTDPNKIVDMWTMLEHRADDVLARETVSTKFGHELDQLDTLGQQYTNVGGSQYGVSAKNIKATVQNPYNDYAKTALNISRLSEYPLLTAFNRNLEKGVSTVIDKVANTFREVKGIQDLDKVNAALQEAGINHAYKDAAEVLLANHTAPKAYVSSFIRGANAILSNTFLRLDPLNALNNAVGAQVLLGHETSTLLKAISRGDESLVGELAQLSRVNVPGTTDNILSPSKFIAQANKNWFSKDPALTAMYKTNGWTTRISDQYKAMLDDLALQGNEQGWQLQGKLKAALDKAKSFGELGEKLTGNKLAEEYNRFVAADVARQISDLGIKAGLMDLDSQASFINTFINRTQANTLASQRPLIFQGPIGQAVGLFQSFQFNTMQQLFRGISEGGPKDAAMMLGLQGTMYGMNGLPAFQYINQHIIGTASGNKDHTDAYSTIYGSAGKTAGDWLMYGIPSNLLQTNIYSRGDINPRTATILPLNPADIVAVSAFAKFAGNIKESVGKIAGGGDVWQSILQGLEHNTISRPLSGLAQVAQSAGTGKVFSTTNAGDLSFANDFMSLATLSRLAGGKPLDEALANDEVARSMVHKAADRERMKTATETFKTNVIGNPGGDLDPTVVTDYMKVFVHNGGRQEDFNKNMLNAMTKVNGARANQVIANLKGPYADHMKSLMGGSVEDFNSVD